MTTGRPAPVVAHVRRPLWWLLALVPFLGLATVASVLDAERDVRRRDRSINVSGTLVDRRAGDGGARVRYVHPITEQELTVTIPVEDRARLPARGDPVALDADPEDPEGARLDGEVYRATTELGWNLPYLAVPIAVWARRRWSIARSERLMAGAGPSFAMLGAIAPTAWSSRRTELHLWALDAAPGSPSLCRVGLLATGHLPLGGNVFRVEVKGRPRPFGRLVARSPDTDAVLWPAGAGLPRGARGRPERTIVAAAPAPEGTAPAAAARVQAPWQALGLGVGVSLLGLLLVGVVAVLVIRGNAEDRRFREGERVVAEVTSRDDPSDVLTLAFSVGGEQRTGRAEVIYIEDFPVGRRYPAYIHPENPSRLYLAKSRYNAVGPFGWGSLPLLAGVVVLGTTLRHWRLCQRLARRGGWRPFEMWAGGEAWATVVIPWTGQAACSVRLGLPWVAAPIKPGPPVSALVAGDPQPGGRTVVHVDGRSVIAYRTGAARQLRWWTS